MSRRKLLKIQQGKTNKQIAFQIGISEPTWKVRKARFLAGKINKDSLLAPKHVYGCKDDLLNVWDSKQKTNKEMAKILQISPKNWISRKYRYRKGLIDNKGLYYVGNQPSGKKGMCYRNRRGNFDNLSNKPRNHNLAKIPIGKYDNLGNESESKTTRLDIATGVVRMD